MTTQRAQSHLKALVEKYPCLLDNIDQTHIRAMPHGGHQLKLRDMSGDIAHKQVYTDVQTIDVEKKILFAHFSPFRYGVEDLGLPLYAATAMPNATIHVTYDKGGPGSMKFLVKENLTSRIESLLTSYDVIIARSSVLKNMKRRPSEAAIVDSSDYIVNIKTMSHKPNYVYAHHYFEEEEMCPVGSPHMRKLSQTFLRNNKKQKIVLITGSLWHVKNQLSFFEQASPDLLADYDIVVVGPEKDPSYVSRIENVCAQRGFQPYIIGGISEEFLVNLYSLSRLNVVSMDMRVFGQPKGYPRVLGEGIACRCLPLCNDPVTVPDFWNDTCLRFDHETEGSLNDTLSSALSIVKDEGFFESYDWGDVSFESQCDEILRKCLRI